MAQFDLDYFVDREALDVNKLNLMIQKIEAMLNGGLDESNMAPDAIFPATKVPDAIPKSGGVLRGPLRTKYNAKIDGVSIAELDSRVKLLANQIVSYQTEIHRVGIQVVGAGDVVLNATGYVEGDTFAFPAPTDYSGIYAQVQPSYLGFEVPDGENMGSRDFVTLNAPVRTPDKVYITPNASLETAPGGDYAFEVFYLITILWMKLGVAT